MEWKPITHESLLTRHIELLEHLFNDYQKSFWSFIKINPEKWSEATVGELGGGFWAVAIFGHTRMAHGARQSTHPLSQYIRISANHHLS